MILLDFFEKYKFPYWRYNFLKMKNPYFMKPKKKFFFLCYIYMEDNQGKFQGEKKIKILYIVIWDIVSI